MSAPGHPPAEGNAPKPPESPSMDTVADGTADAGEPTGGAESERPAMLGRRFRITLASGMAVGLFLALVGHEALSYSGLGRNEHAWSWFITAIGGIAVGGALSLFAYGVSTDRSDTGPKPRGQADVTTEGEWSRTKRRRRRMRRRRDPRA
jgi:hypothetical protein